MSQHSLTGGEHHIRREESAYVRIVVPALQIIPARFLIVNIPSIPERVEIAQRTRQRTGARDLPAPAAIGVFYYGIVFTVNQTDDVVLLIADIVVICAVEVDGNDISGCVVAEPITLTVPLTPHSCEMLI